MVTSGAVNDKVVISVMLDQSILNELAHKAVGHRSGLDIFLELHDLLLENVDFLILRLVIDLLLCCSLLFFFDLGLSSAPLATGLQHVGRYTFRHYTKKELFRWQEREGTYMTHELKH